MKCIIRAADYLNLTEFKIYYFNKIIASHYFMDKLFMFTSLCRMNILKFKDLALSMYFILDNSLFEHNFKQQIRDLVLVGNENNIEVSLK